MPPPVHSIPFTKAAYEKLHTDLAQLQKDYEAALERMKIAREMGDLSENGAYRYAKQEMGDLSRRMRQVKYLILFGKIEEQHSTDQVSFGSTVVLFDGKKDITYMLVSEYESDPKLGKISMKSPLGVALMGKKTKDSVELQLPNGEKTYTIQSIA